VTLVSAVVDAGLGNTSWIVDLGEGRLAVVDPGRHPGPYLAEAERRGARVAFSLETHLHADFVTGSRELASYGATVVAPAGAELAWPHQPVDGGQEIELGGLTVRALATPGHTPEHLAYLLGDGDRPLGVFTGGSLLVGAVARTDLISPDATEDLARQMWRCIHREILTLPDDTPVYPTHGAGSFCSAPAQARRWTTVGAERRGNPLVAAGDEDAFVAGLVARLGSYPPYFRLLRDVNRAGPDVLGIPQPPLEALDVTTFQQKLGSAVLVDTRPVEAWAAGHISGALANPLRDQFASWLGWLVHRSQPLLFVVGADQDRAEVVRQSHQIGYDHLVGEVAGGITAWAAAGLPLETTPLVAAGAVDGVVLDVRQASERAAGHIPGTVHIELGDVARAAGDLRSIRAVMCGHGERAASAASLLERAGHPGVAVVVGGPEDWARATGRQLAEG
jgi:glyoxylase-like metal-dependent hydrolase (beta-lactamase superfamily II)/rhodanese-related sulfurtransferase